MREDEQAEKNGVFPGTAPCVTNLGGGYKGESGVTFEEKEWALNEEIQPLRSKPGFPDLSTFESGAGLPFAGLCFVYCRVWVASD